MRIDRQNLTSSRRIDNYPRGGYVAQTMAKIAPKTTLFLLIAAVFTACTALQQAKNPSPEEALEGLKTACVVADLTPNLPEEAQKACDLVEKLEIKAEADVE
jgi:hypothetical protein